MLFIHIMWQPHNSLSALFIDLQSVGFFTSLISQNAPDLLLCTRLHTACFGAPDNLALNVCPKLHSSIRKLIDKTTIESIKH